ncbi:MAG: hypothetical protein B0A82_16925 [Alkalinema sp. CACIAM 70d]|nr:MAG: hypothetical protein B0A82_16925 [Alkalinema sp. CACIAM 70d]
MSKTDAATNSQIFLPWPQRMIALLKKLQTNSIDSLPGCFYIYDLIEQRNLCASSPVTSLLGYTIDEIHTIGVNGLATLIHPDDLQHVSDHYQRFTTLQWGEVICSEYRMKHSDGSWCWIRSEETPLLMAIEAFPKQILGFIQTTSPTTGGIARQKKHRQILRRPISL